MNYNKKIFRVIENSEFGETSGQTIFHYIQKGNVLTGTYIGGTILKGHLLGLVEKDGTIKMCYHQINTKGELRLGTCDSVPEVLVSGKIRLHETWKWTTGECGKSVVEEVEK